MLPSDRRYIRRLERRVYILIAVVFLMLVWVKNKYDDAYFLDLEAEALNYEIYEKDSTINDMQRRLDSINQTKQPVLKIIHPKYKPKIDTVRVKKDTIINKIELDTIKKDTLN